MSDARASAIFPVVTRRLLLRPFVRADAPAKFRLDCDPDIQRYLGGPTTPERSARALDYEIAQFELHGFGLVALVVVATDQIVGYGALQQEPSTEGLEVIVAVATEARGRGYGLEAAGALIDAACGPLRQDKVFGRVNPSNTASARLVARLGMQRVGDRTDPLHGRVEHVYAPVLRGPAKGQITTRCS